MSNPFSFIQNDKMTTNAEETKAQKPSNASVPVDQFNWEAFETEAGLYGGESKEQIAKEYDQTLSNIQAGEVMEVLGLPEEIRPLLIVAFGKPAEEIHLVDVQEDGNTNYYRDENDVHYVPKRTLADELLN